MAFKDFFRKKEIFLNFTLYYKTRQRLLQNAAALLDDHFITKRGKGSYKTRQVLQNAAIITKRGSTPRTHISLDAKFWPSREWLHF